MMVHTKQVRIERRGEVAPLTPRVVEFLVEALGGKSLDSKETSQELRPDYVCLGGRLAVEIKTLEEDATIRLDNFTDELRLRDDWPQIYGNVPLHAVLKNMGDAENLQRKALDRIGRAIISHVRKANKQLRAHAEKSGQKNLVKLLILINEDHEIYEPKIAAFALQKALTRKENGVFVYADVDAVLYLTERHALLQDKLLVYPLLSVEGIGIEIDSWKRNVVDVVVGRWEKWNGYPGIKHDSSVTDFSVIEDIPPKMRRQEKWELDYRRNPYMASISEEQLRDIFDEIALSSLLVIHKESPEKPSQEQSIANLERSAHMFYEMAQRGIPITRFKFEPERAMDAAKRMKLSETIMRWLAQEFRLPRR
jgi:hypothetical protein